MIILAIVLAIAAFFPAVASAATDCNIRPLVLLGNTTTTTSAAAAENAGRVHIQLGDDDEIDHWMSVSIVDNDTIVNSTNGSWSGPVSLQLPGLGVRLEKYIVAFIASGGVESPSSNVIGLVSFFSVGCFSPAELELMSNPRDQTRR